MVTSTRARHGGLLALLLLLGCGPAWAGAGVWTNTGPFGGNVLALAVDPSTPTTLYAAAPGGGVFKSTNGGASWVAASQGIATQSVTALAIDPQTPTTLYAAAFGPATFAGASAVTAGALFKSTDGAQSWTELPVDPVTLEPGPATPPNGIGIDPEATSTIFAASLGGVFKSVDGGMTWSGATDGSNGLPAGGDFGVVVVDPQHSATIYAGSTTGPGAPGAGMFKSVDGGATWQAINTGLTACSFLDVVGLAIDPQTPSTLYAALSCGSAATGVYQSVNGGGSWTQVETGTAGPVAVAPTTVYVGGSVDGVGSGVEKSTDGGASFVPASSGLGVLPVNALAVSAQNPSTLYAGSFNGVFVSGNAAATWSAASNGLSLMPVSVLAIDPTAPTTLYAGTGLPGQSGDGIYKSVDGGASWSSTDLAGLTVFSGLPPQEITALAVDPATPSTVYAGDDLGDVFVSTNGGTSWAQSDNGIATGSVVVAIQIDPNAPGTVYAALDFGVFKSTDGGSSWQAAGTTGLPANAGAVGLSVLGLSPTVLALATVQSGVFLSSDGGNSWQPLDTSFTSSVAPASGLLQAPIPVVPCQQIFDNFQADIYAANLIDLLMVCRSPDAVKPKPGCTPCAVYSYILHNLRLSSGSTSEAPAGAQVPPGAVVTPIGPPDGADPGACDPLGAAVFDPVTAGNFYIASGCGVARGSNFGAQLTAMNLGLPLNLQVAALAITPNASDLYAGSQGGGVYRYSLVDSPIAAAVLPSSRSVEIGAPATAFATMINAGSAAATGCFLAPSTRLPAGFSYQTTAPGTNALTGSANTPVNIPAGGVQTFLFSYTPGVAINPIDAQLDFDCDGLAPAIALPGINTLLFSGSPTPVPDVVALAATPSQDGIIDIPGSAGANAFAVATLNLGASASLTASPSATTAGLPISLAICQTNPSTAQCLATAAASVTTTINGGDTPTFAIFVGGGGIVAYDPVGNRIAVQFTDASGNIRGSTSVAVRTQ